MLGSLSQNWLWGLQTPDDVSPHRWHDLDNQERRPPTAPLRDTARQRQVAIPPIDGQSAEAVPH
jgi:hypothetical protein